jgi:hypothetical protein
MFIRSIAGWAGFVAVTAVAAPFPPDQIEFFEKQVRPVLAERCYDCHGSHRHENGLRLDQREAILRGSDYGPVVKSGDPAGSKLIQAVKHLPGVESMPKKGEKLNTGQVAALEKWISMGLPWPEEKAVAAAKQAEPHWAFQKVPPVQAGVTIDVLVDKKLAAASLKRAEPASAETLVRRLYLALTGLPPSWEQVQTFVKDARPDKVTALVDELLKSPRFGERWARYWLDVARYSDTEGYQTAGRDIRYPYAYTYRDWVIQAFNEDMPYDQFVCRQLAADRLEKAPNSPQLAALGFLTVGDTFIGSRDLQTDDRIDVVTRGLLGLTVGCARCHDHKYDPIPSKDYYALYSVFNSSQIPAEFPVIGKSKDAAAAAEYEKQAAGVFAKMEEYKSKIWAELRTAESITAYLIFARSAKQKNWQDSEFRGKAGEAKLRDRVASKWQRFIASQPHASTTALVRFAELSDAEFAAKAPTVRSDMLAPNSKLHSVIRAELEKRGEMKSFADVANLYGSVFATAVSGKAPAGDGAWSDLKAFLERPLSPLSLAVAQVEEIYTRKDLEGMVKLRNEIKRIEVSAQGAPPRAMVMLDKPKPEDVSVFIRGNPGRRGAPAPRSNLTVLGGQKFTDGSGRLELARAIASKDNPLTARVMVNRVWLQLFGTPLVNQTSDFGVQTTRPLQADVLDHLAASFMEQGWSLKKLIRQIVISGTYAQSSKVTPDKALKDADNAYLSRFNRQRLDYESMRDAVNATAGTLDASALGGRPVDLASLDADKRRSVYHFVDRYEQPTVPAMFDFANPDAHSPQRYNTTVPQQALFLMNSPFMSRQAQKIVEKTNTVEALYQRILLRNPTPSEAQRVKDFLAQSSESAKNLPPFSWRYGYAPLVKEGNTWKLNGFTKMPHYTTTRKMWSPGPQVPMEPWGHLLILPNGGHPGRDAAAVLQWTSPLTGKLLISGEVKRSSERGNGIRVLIMSNKQGVLKEVHVKPKSQVNMHLDVNAAAGEVLSFVVDSMDGNTDSDSYSWVPKIESVSATGARELITAADQDYCDAQGWPFNRSKPQSPLSQLAQVLLMSNEFMFMD